MARPRWVSSPVQVVWRPGWMSEAGRADAMKRADSRMRSGWRPVRGQAHSGVLPATWAFSSSRPVAYLERYSAS